MWVSLKEGPLCRVRKTTSWQRGIHDMGEERKKREGIRSDKLKKVRGDRVKRPGG